MLKDYYGFNKWESILLIGLVSIALVASIFNFNVAHFIKPKVTAIDSAAIQQLANNVSIDTTNGFKNKYNTSGTAIANIKPFNFDPNTLDSAGWIKLGLGVKTITTILNYRNKGGKFYNKEDVKKMYSLPEEAYNILEPYISITSVSRQNTFNDKPKLVVDLNNSDATTLEKLYGIGPASAQRIVEYRSKLGGYVSTTQLSEVYGIPDSTINKIKDQLTINKNAIQYIPINTVLFSTLQNHPYAKQNNTALIILKYRKSKGTAITSFAELQAIPEIDKSILQKLQPYISYK